MTPTMPFGARIRHGTSIVAEIEITSSSSDFWIGRVVSSHWPDELKAALLEYAEIIVDQSFSFVDEARDRIVAWDLRVDGIPGRDDARLLDFQPSSKGTFALKVE